MKKHICDFHMELQIKNVSKLGGSFLSVKRFFPDHIITVQQKLQMLIAEVKYWHHNQNQIYPLKTVLVQQSFNKIILTANCFT